MASSSCNVKLTRFKVKCPSPQRSDYFRRAAVLQALGADRRGDGDSRAGQPGSPGVHLRPPGGSATE